MSKKPFKIEKGIPVPSRSRLPDMPLDQLKAGESFLIDGLAENLTDETAVRQRIFRYHQRHPNVRLSLVRDKEVKGAMRLFRLADREEQ